MSDFSIQHKGALPIPPEWKVVVDCDDADLAPCRTYYFHEPDELESFCQGLLLEDEEFSLYREVDGDWVEQDTSPYDFFTDIGDTPNPLSHGQFLGNFGGEIEDSWVTWRLGQGDRSALDDIEDDTARERATSIFDRLDSMGCWDWDDIEAPNTIRVIKDSHPDTRETLQPPNDDELGYWETEI